MRTVADHQVDDVQPIEQSLRESACADSIEERLGGTGDKPDRCRWRTGEFKRSEYFDQHVLNDWRHLLNVGDQQGAAGGSVKQAASVIPKRPRLGRKVARPGMYEGQLGP